MEEDAAFEQFLAEAGHADDNAAPDASEHLKQLVESAHRQEELLSKMCSIMLGLDSKMAQLATAQERLDQRLDAGVSAVPGNDSKPTVQPSRGTVPQPPGRKAPGTGLPISAAQQAQMEADRLAS